MEELLPMITERDGIPVTTSRAVAEQFGKRHAHVLRDIEELLDQLKNPGTQPNFGPSENPGNGSNFGAVDSTGADAVAQLQAFQFAELNFHPVTYRDSTGREQPMYLLTRDGFTLLAMGFTGARAVQFKVAYINAFNRMERLLKGGITSGDVQRIENRLEILEQTASQGKQTAADSVADLFLQAIREALSTGGYYLGEKYKRNKQDSPQLLGVADWDTVALKATLAYDLYAAATHTKQTATAEEVREAFVAPDAEAAVKEITAIIDSQLDMEKSADLLEACLDASKGVLEEDAKPWERLMWLVRQAYLFGFNYAATLHYEAAEQGYKALFCGGGVRSNPYPLSADIRRCGGLRGGCSNE